MFPRSCFAAVIVTFWLASGGAKSAEAAGHWNVPSSFWQCMGCGYGGGYHAPLVLGPMSCSGWCSPHHYRLPYSPAPAYGCSDYCAGGFAEPTLMEPAPRPFPAPMPPAARTQRPLFLR